MKINKILIITFVIILVTGRVYGDSFSRSMKQGDKYYREKKYDESLKSFEEAASLKSDDPKAQYNKGVVLYKKEEFRSAEQAFLNALASGKEEIEARTVYNSGNSRYKEAENKEQTSPEEAVGSYKKALEYYKRAIELSPEDKDAKYNYEMTKKKIAMIEQQQKQEQEQKSQEQSEKDKGEKGEKSRQSSSQSDRKDQQEQQQQQQEQQQQQQKQGQNKEEEKQSEEKTRQKEEEEQKPQTTNASREKDEQKEQQASQAGEKGEEQQEMSKQEAEMLLRAQKEEENRMRAEEREKRRARRPVVLKDW